MRQESTRTRKLIAELKGCLIQSRMGPSGLFKTQKELAEVLSKASRIPASSAESAISRLFNEGRMTEAMAGELVKVVRAAAGDTLAERVEMLVRSVEAARIRERYKALPDVILEDLYMAASQAASILLSFPIYPFVGSDENQVRIRKEFAHRVDLGNAGLRRVFRTWCFAKEADCYDCLYWLVHDSAKDGKTAEEMFEALADLERSGWFEAKVIHTRACLIHCCLLNVKGLGEFAGYVWFYDQQGNIANVHPLESHYLRAWGDWVREIQEDNPETVQKVVSVEQYREHILAGRRSLPSHVKSRT